jgi:hypothetical protein
MYVVAAVLAVALLGGCTSEATPEPEPTSPTVRNGIIGDTVADDTFSYIVSDFKCRASECRAIITVMNISSDRWLLFPNFQAVFDLQGREFPASDELSSSELNQDLDPGEIASDVLVWDVPADFEPDHLELHKAYLSTGVEVKV